MGGGNQKKLPIAVCRYTDRAVTEQEGIHWYELWPVNVVWC